VEFFLWLRRGPATLDEETIHTVVRSAAPPGAAGEKVDP
jgi:23S rRNA (cytidine1920-2'-O)/16S rRNA (cytidine1409-2'-O)-methyltransferase